jgi:hypothetical protein
MTIAYDDRGHLTEGATEFASIAASEMKKSAKDFRSRNTESKTVCRWPIRLNQYIFIKVVMVRRLYRGMRILEGYPQLKSRFYENLYL